MALTRPRIKQPRITRPRVSRAPARTNTPSLEALTIGAQYDIALHNPNAQTTPTGSLTAAALTVQQKNSQDIRRLVQPWQAESMSYYHLVPEHSFATRFMAQMLSKVRLFPARLDPETNEPEEITSGVEVDLLARIQDRSGSRSELQRSYAALKYLIGEVYLTASPDRDREEVWECLSPNELRVQPQGIASRFRAPMLPADQYIIGNDAYHAREYGGIVGPAFSESGPDIILVYRMWRPSPAYSWLADCSSHANLGLLEELVLSTLSVKAQLKSRLNTVGAFLIPEEASFPSLGNEGDEDPMSDLLQQRFSEAIMAAIKDPGAAAAMAPIVVQMAGEFIKDTKLIRFNDNAGELTEIAQRGEMVERYGIGAELPPELFKAMDTLNHWTGWLVDKQTYDNYGDPAAREMASDINAAYFQPACRDAGVKDWKTITIGVDPAEAINHPNRSKDALDLFDRLLINGEVTREQLGYNANDAMSQAEKDEQAGLKIKDGSLYRFGIPAVRANIEPEAGEVEGAPAAPGEPAVNPATGGKAPPGPPKEGVAPPPSGKGPSAGPDATSGGPAVTASAAPQTALLALAQAAVHRARDVAGVRLRARAGARGKECVECQDAIRDLPNWDVAAVLGAEQAAALGVSPAELVEGSAGWFAAMVEADGVSAGWAAELGAMVEQHAAAGLFEAAAPALPDGFVRLLARVHLPLERG